MKTCFACKEEKPESEYWKCSKKKDGLNIRCAPCMNAYQAVRYRTKPSYGERIRKNNKAATERAQRYVYDYLAEHPCVDCGESDIIVLDFDHVRGEKKHNIAMMRTLSIKTIQDEIAKCEVRCANCHRRKTAERHGGWYKMKLSPP